MNILCLRYHSFSGHWLYFVFVYITVSLDDLSPTNKDLKLFNLGLFSGLQKKTSLLFAEYTPKTYPRITTIRQKSHPVSIITSKFLVCVSVIDRRNWYFALILLIIFFFWMASSPFSWFSFQIMWGFLSLFFSYCNTIYRIREFISRMKIVSLWNLFNCFSFSFLVST